ncbi:MAG: ABC transporter ATP-binding protein, partial [Asgard group archaeon]|nr:ABC transporter ATP-binding protein [Asgard group archaeon]
IKDIINEVYYNKNRELLQPLIITLFVVSAVAALFRFLQRYSMEVISQKIIYDLRNNLYSQIQKQSIDFFDRMETGQLISRGTSDINRIRRLFSIGLRIFFRGVCLFIGIFTLIGMLSWQLLLIVAGIAPIMFFTVFSYAKRIRPLSREIQQKFGDLNSVLSENVHGSRVVRAFAAKDFENEKFEKENQRYLELNLQLGQLRSFIVTTFPLVLGVGTFFLLLFGGRAVIAGTLQVGTLMAINSYLIILQRPTRFIAFAILHYQEGTASLERVFEVIDREKEVKEKPDAEPLKEVDGKITFENVSFRYREDQPLILKNINLAVKPNEKIAFLGTTGSGKSTIVSLVPRFYDPEEGTVKIDGTDVKDVTLDSLRKNIALVQQEAFLFAKTIRENIAFGKPEASEEEIIQAAKIAQAHEFIMSFNDGYDTIVGEEGATLSGGQKQRLTIARALLLDAPILIMDDSSSALDFETENQFQKAVHELIQDRTTLIVTQRLSTIKFATKMVVMDKGEIVEMGTHKELMAKNGLYKHLYETQLIEQDFKPAETLASIKKKKRKEVKATGKGGQQ